MLLGIGIDILSAARFQGLLTRRPPAQVAKRICSPNEYRTFESDIKGSASDTFRYLSTRYLFAPWWVLKEAAYKALSGRYPVSWKSLEITRLPTGQPTMRYIPPDSAPLEVCSGEVDLMCTLSHDAGVIVGVVIAQLKP